jgi:hypothetical protein
MAGRTKQQLLSNRYLSCGAGGIQAPHVHMRNFMARGGKAFLQTVKGGS